MFINRQNIRRYIIRRDRRVLCRTSQENSAYDISCLVNAELAVGIPRVSCFIMFLSNFGVLLKSAARHQATFTRHHEDSQSTFPLPAVFVLLSTQLLSWLNSGSTFRNNVSVNMLPGRSCARITHPSKLEHVVGREPVQKEWIRKDGVQKHPLDMTGYFL